MITLHIKFFNKLHLDKCNVSKTPLTSDSGREGEEGACAHMPGGGLQADTRAFCVPDLFWP